MGEKLRIVQVGIGSWGWSWIKVVTESPYWELVGVVDLDNEARERAIDNYGINPRNVFDKLENAMKAIEADAALVVVPPEYHKDVCLVALENGLHCIVEKPIAPTIKDARKMIRVADKVGLKLMVSQNYRFKNCPQTVKKIINSKIIGEIGSVYVNFHKWPPFTGFRTEMEEPLITDMSIHHFDMMRGILGLEPVVITARSWNTKWSQFKGNPIATVVFEMKGGVVVTYTGSWVSQGWETTWDGDWYIQGDGGEIYWAKNEVIVRPSDVFKTVFTKGLVETHKEMRAEPVKLPNQERWACLEEFASSIKENREPETSGSDNINTLAMVIGACISLKSNRPVTIEEVMNS